MTLKNNILSILLMVLTIGMAYFSWLLLKPDTSGRDIEKKPDNRTINIAVAANYKQILSNSIDKYSLDNEITEDFTINIISGSTGGLFTQIKNGAPFDLFLAADMERPQALVQANLTIEDTPYIYTTGKLAIAYRSVDSKEDNCDGNDLNSIYETIIKFFEDNRYKSLGSKAQEFSKEFKWNKIIKEYLKLI